MSNRHFTFLGGELGRWRIREIRPVIGSSIDFAPRLDIRNEVLSELPTSAKWLLRGVTSHQRYTNRPEQASLLAAQPVLGRKDATHAALIPLTKSAAWWELTQDERREIFEAQSSHIATGLRYLPAIARRLHHSRDLGEPFDFVTWFEFAPTDTRLFDELLADLRGTPEWKYVEREVDIRLTREV